MNQDKSKTDMNQQGKAPTAVDATKLKPGMLAVCSNGAKFGVVDRIEGTTSIKLTQDEKGVQHFIPMGWVARIDDKVHANLPLDQIQREWTTDAPRSPRG